MNRAVIVAFFSLATALGAAGVVVGAREVVVRPLAVGYAESRTISCTSAAAVEIKPTSGKAITAYDCQNTSTTKVAVGGSTISDPGTTADANIYCSTNCPSQEWGGGVRQEFCRGDTDTTITCRFSVQ